MLRELCIKNFVLIEEATLQFDPQLTIISGETGGGKSMFLESLRFLCGAKAKADLIGKHGDRTEVMGTFEVKFPPVKNLCEELEIKPKKGQITIKRELYGKGKSRCYINDQTITIKNIRRFGHILIDVHSQDDQRTLLSPNFHREMVDRYGRLEKPLHDYTDKFQEVEGLKNRLLELREKEKTRRDRIELVQFQLTELEELDLSEGEKEALIEKHNRMSHAAEICEMARKWQGLLVHRDRSAVERLGKCRHELDGMVQYDSRFEEVVSIVEEARVLVDQAGILLREMEYAGGYHPDELSRIERRITEIESMEKKYQCEGDDLARYRWSLEEELTELESLEEFKGNLESDISQGIVDLKKLGKKLTDARKKVAPKLAQEIEGELHELGMEGARLEIPIKPCTHADGVGPYGADHLEFTISPNPGMDLKSLGAVSSGGEMSRIMFALKSILSDKYDIPTLFFDEIDTNIGGRLGHIVGDRLKKLSQDHQVFCITHSPQIAVFGHTHFKIKKEVEKQMTYTRIIPSKGEQRVDEIAEMIQGQGFSKTTRRQASELLHNNWSKRPTPRTTKRSKRGVTTRKKAMRS